MALNVILLRKIARKFVLNNASGIVVYNDEIANWYQNNFPKLHIGICPNIQNPKSFLYNNLSELKEYANNYIDKFNLRNKKIILYIGRLHEVKGLTHLIKAFNRVNTGNEKLVLVGDGPLKDNLMTEVEIHGLNDKIVFAGRYNGIQMHAWYYLADLFILPSMHEPFGAVVNEALIHGVPVFTCPDSSASRP